MCWLWRRLYRNHWSLCITIDDVQMEGAMKELSDDREKKSRELVKATTARDNKKKLLKEETKTRDGLLKQSTSP